MKSQGAGAWVRLCDHGVMPHAGLSKIFGEYPDGVPILHRPLAVLPFGPPAIGPGQIKRYGQLLCVFGARNPQWRSTARLRRPSRQL